MIKAEQIEFNFNSRLLCWLQNYKISSKKSGTILVASSDQGLKALRLAAISKLYICIGAKRIAPTFPLTTHFRNPIFNERFHSMWNLNPITSLTHTHGNYISSVTKTIPDMQPRGLGGVILLVMFHVMLLCNHPSHQTSDSMNSLVGNHWQRKFWSQEKSRELSEFMKSLQSFLR